MLHHHGSVSVADSLVFLLHHPRRVLPSLDLFGHSQNSVTTRHHLVEAVVRRELKHLNAAVGLLPRVAFIHDDLLVHVQNSSRFTHVLSCLHIRLASVGRVEQLLVPLNLVVGYDN